MGWIQGAPIDLIANWKCQNRLGMPGPVHDPRCWEQSVHHGKSRYIGCSHHRPANKDNPSPNRSGQQDPIDGFPPIQKNCEVAWGKTSVEMDGKGSSSGSTWALDGKLDSTSRNPASVPKLGWKQEADCLCFSWYLLLFPSYFISLSTITQQPVHPPYNFFSGTLHFPRCPRPTSNDTVTSLFPETFSQTFLKSHLCFALLWIHNFF